MRTTLHLKEPSACTESERRDFARLVRLAFQGSDETLEARILNAACLAFCYPQEGELGAIAGLKAPGDRYRQKLFEKAAVRADPAEYPLDLGWVFVLPSYRGHGFGESLCRRLLARVPTTGVFSTTRPDNRPMIRILLGLGFLPDGKPYPHPRRDEELAVFLRSAVACRPLRRRKSLRQRRRLAARYLTRLEEDV